MSDYLELLLLVLGLTTEDATVDERVKSPIGG
jgi:hypothetical protein